MKHFILMLFVAATFSSCYVTTYTVGSGGKDSGRPGHFDVRKKQWYLFAGLVNLDKSAPDKAHQRAGSPQNYTVRETMSFGDLCLCALTAGIACPKTIRISKGN